MKPRNNPFAAVYALCNQGDSKAKWAALPDFPRSLDVEVTNRCNFTCLMCPTGVDTVRRAKGFMSDAVFHRLLEQIAPWKTPLRFIRWGEPTLHPRLPQYIRKAGEIGCLTHLNTNGSLLTEEMVEHLMKAGLDSIKFSFQGVDRKSFREMRNRDFFDELLARVKRLYDRRGDGHKPYIHVSTTITYETPEQVRAFRNRVAPFADLVTVGHTALEHIVPEKTRLSEADKATLRVLKEKESVLRVHPECPEVYDKLSVNWDGTVSACCADYDDQMLVGDIRTETLADIWKCPKLNAYRKLLAEMRHDELPVCRLCWDYSGLKHPGGTRKT